MLIAKGTRELAALSAEYSPVVEPAAGRVFLDLTGSRRLFGPPRDVASRLEMTIAGRLGVAAMAGTGCNKLVTRIAADALPEPGVYDVFSGAERSFLAPFPVSVIPGIGSEREAQLLRDLNLRCVHDVAALSVAQLRLAVGAFALLLHERACGIDRSPVQPPRTSTEITEEAFLDQEENDDQILLAELYRLVEGCGLRLRRTGRETSRLNLTVCYADGVSEQGTHHMTAPEALDLPLFAASEKLFRSTCRRRVRVKGLRLSCGHVAEPRGQLELFGTAEQRPWRDRALQQSLDGLRERYGIEAISWGRTMAICPERPEPEVTGHAPANLSEYRYHTLTKRGG